MFNFDFNVEISKVVSKICIAIFFSPYIFYFHKFFSQFFFIIFFPKFVFIQFFPIFFSQIFFLILCGDVKLSPSTICRHQPYSLLTDQFTKPLKPIEHHSTNIPKTHMQGFATMRDIRNQHPPNQFSPPETLRTSQHQWPQKR